MDEALSRPRRPAAGAILRGLLLCGSAGLAALPLPSTTAPPRLTPVSIDAPSVLAYRLDGGLNAGTQTLGIAADGQFRLQIGNALSLTEDPQDGQIDGAGVFEGRLADKDRQQVERIRSLLCRARLGRRPPTELDAGLQSRLAYRAACDDGRSVGADADQFPASTAGQVAQALDRLRFSLAQSGHRRLKLDVQVVEAAPQGPRFRLRWRFINRGEQALTVENPAGWTDNGGNHLEGATLYAESASGLAYRFMPSGEDIVRAGGRAGPLSVPAGESREIDLLVAPPQRGVRHGNLEDFVTERHPSPRAGRYTWYGNASLSITSAAWRDPPEATQRVDLLLQPSTLTVPPASAAQAR